MKHPIDLEDHLREVHVMTKIETTNRVKELKAAHLYDHENGWDANHTHPN